MPDVRTVAPEKDPSERMEDDVPMAHKTVVITGASTGIGRACALLLDGRGWEVYAGVRKKEDAASLEAEASDRLTSVMLDVADQGSVDVAALTIGEALGDRPLAGLVNNAGITIQGPLEFLPPDELRRQFEVNVVGQLSVTQAFMPTIYRA